MYLIFIIIGIGLSGIVIISSLINYIDNKRIEREKHFYDIKECSRCNNIFNKNARKYYNNHFTLSLIKKKYMKHYRRCYNCDFDYIQIQEIN